LISRDEELLLKAAEDGERIGKDAERKRREELRLTREHEEEIERLKRELLTEYTQKLDSQTRDHEELLESYREDLELHRERNEETVRKSGIATEEIQKEMEESRRRFKERERENERKRSEEIKKAQGNAKLILLSFKRSEEINF
jgi:hypothetical protein